MYEKIEEGRKSIEKFLFYVFIYKLPNFERYRFLAQQILHC